MRVLKLTAHLEVHHVNEERCSEYEDLGVYWQSLIEANLKVVRVSESLPETTFPLFGDWREAGAVSVEDIEDDVITEGEVAPGPPDLEDLVTHAVEHVVNGVPPRGPLPHCAHCLAIDWHCQRLKMENWLVQERSLWLWGVFTWVQWG